MSKRNYRDPDEWDDGEEPADRPSPFDIPEAQRDGGPPQELCILMFPVHTWQRVSDEATSRGMTFNDAVAQAFTEWLTKPQPQLEEPEVDPHTGRPKGRYRIGGN